MTRKLVWEKPSEFIRLLRDQRKLELSHAEALRPTMEAASNEIASTLLESLIHDSLKHASLCKVLIDAETGVIPTEMDVGEAVDMSQAIEEHMKSEEEMIKRLESMLGKTEDEKTRAVLGYMLSDERLHHNTLKRMARLFTQSETRSEEYFDLFERYTKNPKL